MMRPKIVPLPRPAPAPVPQADTDAALWPERIAARLTGIERLVRRLEWQIWGFACGALALLLLDLLQTAPRR